MTTLTGTMLTPGVSLNGRLYTKELIRKAHDRLAERIADGTSPVTMLTHHDAEDDSTRIVGQITAVKMAGDNLDYTAELAATDAAKTIEALVAAKKPFLKNVSIRGYWLGPVETKMVDGQQVTTADDLEVDGLDFTKSPGVKGATVTAAEAAAAETSGRVLITESATARVGFTETAPEPTLPVFADNGYQSDKIKRFPITTAAEAATSWTRIGDKAIAEAYTANQQKRIRGRIKSALINHGVTMTETTPTAATSETTTEPRLSDVAECYDSVGTAGFSISAYNGPLTVSVSAYHGIEPADLAGVATAAMAAAVGAVHAMDPDDDGDVDAGESEGQQPDDDTMESQETSASTAENTATEVAQTEQEAEVAENATETAQGAATEAAPVVAEESAPITKADLASAVAEAVKAALAPASVEGVVSTTETAATESAPVTETAEQMSARIKEELISEMRQNGTLGRKGLVEHVSELAGPAKPLHEMSDDELRAETERRVVPLMIPVQ
jgi:hypothetical protein